MTDGSLVAAVQDAFWQQTEYLLLHHTNPWELDEALVAWGYALGPCEAQDIAGLDQVLARAPSRPVPILPRMVAEGRIGKLGGVGYYRYPGGGGAVIDPLIEDLIREEAWFAKIERSAVSDEMLVAEMNDALAAACRTASEQEETAALVEMAVGFPLKRIGELQPREPDTLSGSG